MRGDSLEKVFFSCIEMLSSAEMEARVRLDQLDSHIQGELLKEGRSSAFFRRLVFLLEEEFATGGKRKVMELKNIFMNHLSRDTQESISQLMEGESETAKEMWEHFRNLDLGCYLEEIAGPCSFGIRGIFPK